MMKWVLAVVVVIGLGGRGWAAEGGIVEAPPEVPGAPGKPVGRGKLPNELEAKPEPTAEAAATPVAKAVALFGGSPEEKVAAFFKELEADRVKDAYAGLITGTVVASRPEEAQRLLDQTQSALDAYGPMEGFELIRTEMVGDHLVRKTYLLLGEVLPLRWKFYFYGVGGEWKLVDLRVDDNLVETVDEATSGN